MATTFFIWLYMWVPHKGQLVPIFEDVAAAGVEVLQDVLAKTQSTIQPLVPYLDTLRWVLIASALSCIAITIHARLDDWKQSQR